VIAITVIFRALVIMRAFLVNRGTVMKVKPMLFNAEMVKAIIDGRKTVTRRPMTPQPQDSGEGYYWWPSKKFETMIRVSDIEHMPAYKEAYCLDLIKEACPVANVGDLIYVRETFCDSPCGNAPGLILYRAGYPQGELLRKYESVMSESEIRWSPSIHMPRKHSRITLKVTDVRIERVQDITEVQAKNEGASKKVWFMPHGSHEADWLNDGDLKAKYKTGFANIWEGVYQNWSDNPYVWVIEFDVIMMNVDEYINTQSQL